MPVARFEMPDGRIGRFEVPEGTTPEQAQTLISESLSEQSEVVPETQEEPSFGSQFIESAKQAGSGILEGSVGVVNLPMEFTRAAGEVLGVNRKYLPLSTSEIEQRLTESGITADKPETTGGKAVRFAGSILGGASTTPIPVKSTALTSIPSKAPEPTKVPELDELSKMAKSAYERAEQAGVVISKNSYRRFIRSLDNELVDAGIDKTLHPKASAAFKRLSESSGKQMTLKELDTLRRIAKGAAKSIEPDERRIARIVVDKLDDYATSLTPGDVKAGDAQAAVNALTEARGLWTRFRKGEVVEDLITRAKDRAAQFSGSGYENALRTEFRNLARNPKRMRGFSAREQKAIRHVARGGPMENALRFIGKFAPTGVVSTALGGGLAYAIGGPAGIALVGGGIAGRIGAKELTKRSAEKASELMRSGGNLPVNESLLSKVPDISPNVPRSLIPIVNESKKDEDQP